MTAPRAARLSATGWWFSGLLLAIGWLLPTHTLPWTTFYAEWQAGLGALVAASLVLSTQRHTLRLPVWIAGATVLALLPLAQAALGGFAYPDEARLIVAYLFGGVAMAAISMHSERAAPSKLLEVTFGAIAVAAVLSTAIAFHQWLRLDLLGLWAAPLGPALRPVANVGQSNNLATLLVWGLCALLWFHERGRLPGAAAAAAAIFVLAGVVLTQSRTGLLQVMLLGAAVLVAHTRWRSDRRRLAFVVAAMAAFVAAVLLFDTLSQWVLSQPARGVSEQMNVGKRPAIWAMFAEAAASRPWFGWGANQSLAAHAQFAEMFPEIRVPAQHAHNIVLDLAVWFGVPVAALVTIAACAWVWCRVARVNRSQWIVLTTLGVLLVHAMLELPHAHLFFLLPAAVLVGSLQVVGDDAAPLRLPWPAAVAALAVFGLTLAVAMRDYTAIEEDVARHARYEAGIGLQPPPAQEHAWLLRSLQQAYEELRLDPYRALTPDDLARYRQVVTRYPLAGPLFGYAKAAAHNGRPDESRWALGLICDTQPVAVCAEVRQLWAAAGASRPQLAAVPFPETAAAGATR